jgi:hypothetical protein
MIHTQLLYAVVQARIQDMQAAASRHRRATPDRSNERSHELPSSLTVRIAFPDDRDAIARLLELTHSSQPSHPIVLVELDGELGAVLSLTKQSVVLAPAINADALGDVLQVTGKRLRQGGGRNVRHRPWHRRALRRRLPSRFA